jgi:hypothetical protein
MSTFTAIFLKMFWVGLSVDVDLLSLSLGLHNEHLFGLVLDGLGGGEGDVSSVLLSTKLLRLVPKLHLRGDLLRFAVLVLDGDDGAGFIVVVVSVLLPIVELLELGLCNHLVRLLLDVLEGGGGVVSSVLLSTASSTVQSLSMTPWEHVGDLDLENVGPPVDG